VRNAVTDARALRPHGRSWRTFWRFTWTRRRA
jgi:hypothetical protein